MHSIARAGLLLVAISFPVVGLTQAGPSDAQIISAASTAKINAGNRKLAGQISATLRVGEDGKVKEVLVTDNSTEFESALTKVFERALFRPAIDASGKPVEASVAMKIELRAATGNAPKPVLVITDPQHTDKEKLRIKQMRCSDFVWEWAIIRDGAGGVAATEFMPRIATTMYAALRTEAGEYVDAKVWKAAPKALKESADRCAASPQAPFWEGVFKAVMDEAIPK